MRLRKVFLCLAVLPVSAGSTVSNAQDAGAQVTIANPNATFLAQQRALPAAEVIARGESLYQVNCRACHGGDLRGGDQGGPNLLRSEFVLTDIAGEIIGRVVSEGLNRMPAFTSISRDEIEAIAGYIHSIVATSERQGSTPPVQYDLDILVGDAGAGERYFNQQCVSCHSVTGDLSGISSRISDPVNLQNRWVGGGQSGRGRTGSIPITATVTLDSGEQVDGVLLRFDDFYLSLRTATGAYRSFTRKGDSPAVVINDPLTRHKELLAILTDDTIHDVTAYLETLK